MLRKEKSQLKDIYYNNKNTKKLNQEELGIQDDIDIRKLTYVVLKWY